MKRIILIIIFIAAFANAKAQVNVTTSDMPVPGEILPYKTSMSVNGIDITLTGTSYIWDYSSLTSIMDQADTCVSVLSTPLVYNIAFSNPFDPTHLATVAMSQPSFNFMSFLTFTDVYNFYKNSTNKFSQVGFGAKINGIALPVKYNNPEVFYNLPITMNNLDSSTSSYNVSIPGFGYYGQTIKRINLVDGWGTLYLPHDTFNVIRVQSQILIHDSIYSDTIGIGFAFDNTQTEYRYLTTAKHRPVLLINKRNGMGATTTVNYFDDYIPASISEINSENKFEVFPNPAYRDLYINNPKLENYSLSLFDAKGQLVFSTNKKSQQSFSIDVSGFSKGIYFLKIISNQSVCNKKIVVE